jgi:hypothetical protein
MRLVRAFLLKEEEALIALRILAECQSLKEMPKYVVQVLAEAVIKHSHKPAIRVEAQGLVKAALGVLTAESKMFETQFQCQFLNLKEVRRVPELSS